MKKYLKTPLILLFIFLLACSSSDESEGVVSTNDLSSDTTVTTIAEEVAEEARFNRRCPAFTCQVLKRKWI